MVAAGVIALLKQPRRKTGCGAGDWFAGHFRCCFRWLRLDMCWLGGRTAWRCARLVNFTWIQVGAAQVDLGWVLDPLAAVMLVMVSFVGC